MNLPEFKAWFEGFTENLDGAPNEKAWKRIKEKIGKIQDAPPTSRTVFIDHWAQPWRRHFDHYPYWAALSVGGVSNAIGLNSMQTSAQNSQLLACSSAQGYSSEVGRHDPLDDFESGPAFRDLGRAEAKSMNAKT